MVIRKKDNDDILFVCALREQFSFGDEARRVN